VACPSKLSAPSCSVAERRAVGASGDVTCDVTSDDARDAVSGRA
jgi:hypothetical protein